jgi:ferredoxin
MSGKWSIEVDRSVCVGSGTCAASAPEYFVLGGDGKSRPVIQIADACAEVLEAALSCPVEAITVRDEESQQVLDPGQWAKDSLPGRNGS